MQSLKNLDIVGKFIEHSFKNMKAMFTHTVFEVILFEGRLVLSPTHGTQGAKRLNEKQLLVR